MSYPHPALPRILEHLESEEMVMRAFVHDLVSVESPSTVPESQGAVMDLLGSFLGDAGYRVRRLPGRRTGGHLYARPEVHAKGQPIQLLVGHSDTVWPLGTVDRMPIVTDDTMLRGPGSFDMKGGLAQMVFALRAIHAADLEPAVTPVVFVNSDEEVGSFESTRWIRMLARRADRAMILEPGLGPTGRIKTARKGVGQFRIRVRGVSAHTGLEPEKGASAINELAHVILALHGLTDADRGITVNVGQISGGMRPNVVAPESAAVIDVRVPTMALGREIEDAIRALRPTTPGTSIEVEGTVDRPPLERTPRNRILWHAAERVAESLDLPVEETTAGGGSDGNTTSEFTATLDGLGSVGDGAHALHEFIFVDQMAKRAAMLAGLVLLPPMEALG